MRRGAWMLGAALVAFACGDDDEKAPAPKPTPTLKIVQVTSAGGPTWTPESSASCVEIGTDPAGTLVVTLAIQHFNLRPPDACGGLRPCGTAVLLVDGTVSAESATSAISLRMSQLDGSIGTGQHSFRAELHDHLGALLLDKEDQPIFDEVASLDVRPPGGCTTGSDAGQDAADAAADVSEDAALDAASDAPIEASDADPDVPGPDAADAADAAAE